MATLSSNSFLVLGYAPALDSLSGVDPFVGRMWFPVVALHGNDHKLGHSALEFVTYLASSDLFPVPVLLRRRFGY